MEASQAMLANHPVNRKRETQGQRRATSIWLWGQGRAPALPPLTERFGIKGGVISAVDIIHGLGVYAGLERIDVPGITGFLDTNYAARGSTALPRWRETISFLSTSRPPTKPVIWATSRKKFRRWKISMKRSWEPC
jgi:2,3-bisphosphoglycerate-independent phosphoglycerate mutase